MSINHLCAADTSIRHLFVPLTKKQCSLCQGQCSKRSWLESPRLCNTGQCCSARMHNSSFSSSSTLSISLSSSLLKPQESAREGKQRVNRQNSLSLCMNELSDFFGMVLLLLSIFFPSSVCLNCGTQICLSAT